MLDHHTLYTAMLAVGSPEDEAVLCRTLRELWKTHHIVVQLDDGTLVDNFRRDEDGAAGREIRLLAGHPCGGFNKCPGSQALYYESYWCTIHGFGLLHTAVRLQLHSIVKFLLELDGIDVNAAYMWNYGCYKEAEVDAATKEAFELKQTECRRLAEAFHDEVDVEKQEGIVSALNAVQSDLDDLGDYMLPLRLDSETAIMMHGTATDLAITLQNTTLEALLRSKGGKTVAELGVRPSEECLLPPGTSHATIICGGQTDFIAHTATMLPVVPLVDRAAHKALQYVVRMIAQDSYSLSGFSFLAHAEGDKDMLPGIKSRCQTNLHFVAEQLGMDFPVMDRVRSAAIAKLKSDVLVARSSCPLLLGERYGVMRWRVKGSDTPVIFDTVQDGLLFRLRFEAARVVEKRYLASFPERPINYTAGGFIARVRSRLLRKDLDPTFSFKVGVCEHDRVFVTHKPTDRLPFNCYLHNIGSYSEIYRDLILLLGDAPQAHQSFAKVLLNLASSPQLRDIRKVCHAFGIGMRWNLLEYKCFVHVYTLIMIIEPLRFSDIHRSVIAVPMIVAIAQQLRLLAQGVAKLEELFPHLLVAEVDGKEEYAHADLAPHTGKGVLSEKGLGDTLESAKALSDRYAGMWSSSVFSRGAAPLPEERQFHRLLTDSLGASSQSSSATSVLGKRPTTSRPSSLRK